MGWRGRTGGRGWRPVRAGAVLDVIAVAAALVAGLAAVSGCSAGAGGSAVATSGAEQGRSAGPAGVGALATLLAAPASSTSGGDAGSPAGTPTGSPRGTTIAGMAPVTAVTTASGPDLLLFVTPSKNIGCELSPTSVRCDIVQRSWSAPPKPAGCQSDYGQGVSLGTDRADYVCAGDTVVDPSSQVLPYNQAIRSGDIVCVSTKTYLACRNTATNHGFSLSKETVPLRY